MKHLIFLAALAAVTMSNRLAFCQTNMPRSVAESVRATPVDFTTQILPLLKQNCVACHRRGEAEGGLILESHSALIKGGDSGPVVVVGDASASLLLARTSGRDEPMMPPEDNDVGAKPLTSSETELVRRWIAQGAKAGSGDSQIIEWQPVPDNLRTIYALAASPDGQVAAVGRGNRVVLHRLSDGAEIGRLVDPAVEPISGAGSASVDMVQAIAFSPDGRRIATGGFRTVRIWRYNLRNKPLPNVVTSTSAGQVAISSDKTRVATVNAIGDIEIHEASSGKILSRLHADAESISGLSWIADTKQLVCCDSLGRLEIWNTLTAKRVAQANAEKGLLGLTIGDDGRHFAGVMNDGQLRVWQLKRTGRDADQNAQASTALEVVAVDLASAKDITIVNAVVFCSVPEPSILVACSLGVVQIGLTTDKVQRRFDHGSEVTSMATSQDGKLLATGGKDGVARLWSLTDGKSIQSINGEPATELAKRQAERDMTRQSGCIKRLEGRTSNLEAALNKEQKAVAESHAESKKAAAKVIEQEKKRLDAISKLWATENSIKTTTASISAAEVRLAKAADEVEDWQEIRSKVAPRVAEAKRVRDQAAAMLATAEESLKSISVEMTAADNGLQRAKLETESAQKTRSEGKRKIQSLSKQVEELKQAIKSATDAKRKVELEAVARCQALAAAQDALKVATSAIPKHKDRIQLERSRAVKIRRRLNRALQRSKVSTSPIVAIDVDSKGRIVTGNATGQIRAYASGGLGIAVMDAERDFGGAAIEGVKISENRICAFGPHCGSATWSFGNDWSLERVIGSHEGSAIGDRVTALDFRPDGLSLAVGSGPPSRFGDVKIYSIRNGKLIRDFGEVHSDTVLGLRFSPDGRMLASCSADKSIRLLSPVEGKLLRSLEGHTHHVLGLAWQDDGQTIASGSADNQVKIWNVEDGKQRRNLGFPNEVTAVAFVNSSTQIATACADGQCRLHDANSGQGIRSYNAHGDFLYSIAISPDGTTLLTGGQNGVLRIFNLDDGSQKSEFR